MNFLFSFSGEVVIGNQLGRTIGFPTANIKTGGLNSFSGANGVYAVTVLVHNKLYQGMANAGFRPTLDENIFTVEINIFNFSEDIYGETITVYFHAFIRNECKFESLEKLKEQITRDKISVRNVLPDFVEPDSGSQ
jgi:riboflavin kinase / FMN adenylyltransferase